jgi:hypothetical protein
MVHKQAWSIKNYRYVGDVLWVDGAVVARGRRPGKGKRRRCCGGALRSFDDLRSLPLQPSLPPFLLRPPTERTSGHGHGGDAMGRQRMLGLAVAASMVLPPARRPASTGEAGCLQRRGGVLPQATSISEASCFQRRGVVLLAARLGASTCIAQCFQLFHRRGKMLPPARLSASVGEAGCFRRRGAPATIWRQCCKLQVCY